MTKENLINRLFAIEQLAKGSKVKRLFHNPVKYIYAILYKNGIYRFTHKEISVSCRMFTGQTIKVLLPAATDIYLTGGKTHDSEVRLARFFVNNLNPGDTFWDIGAHYGYFSLLARQLVGKEGKIISLEAAPATFNILQKNSAGIENMSVINNAVSEQTGTIVFYELPNLYSEYNALDISQFEQEEWFSKIEAKQVEMDAISLDDLAHRNRKYSPDMIKIDVEGAEYAVMKGAAQLLNDPATNTTLVMEYLAPERNNAAHRQAVKLLRQWAYKTYIIGPDGRISLCDDIEQHLSDQQLDSDNIVFKRAGR